MRFPITTYGSSAIDTMSVNPITGSVRVRFLKGPANVEYRFLAPRRAIMSLLWNSDCSLGEWVNEHL